MTVIVNDQRHYPHGVPCWVDCRQADLEAAQAFYGAVFGWQFANAMPPSAPGAYLIATLDGHDVAALAPAEGPAAWHTYIATDDIEVTAASVGAAGGSVLAAPTDAGPGGRDATVQDPQGAVFHLWQARRRLGAQLVNVPGAWNFSDLHTPDPTAALAFYRAVFGWHADPASGAGMIRLPGYGDHLAATIDPHIYDRQAHAPEGFADVVAGLARDESPHWSVRFTVADRDAAVAAVEQQGGTVMSATETAWTREADVRDPQGAELTLSQFAPPD